MTSKTPAELAEMTPEEIAAWKEAERKAVFGHDSKVRRGKPVEQGKGSYEQPTQNSIDAYIKTQTERRVGGPEKGFEENLKKMRDRLAEYQAENGAEEAA